MTRDVAGYNGNAVGTPSEKPVRHSSAKMEPKESFEPPPLMAALFTYVSYAVLILFGHLADLFRRMRLKKDRIHVNVEGKVRLFIEIEGLGLVQKKCMCMVSIYWSCSDVKIKNGEFDGGSHRNQLWACS